jgi:predicted alpha/beta superfamily hydrolase
MKKFLLYLFGPLLIAAFLYAQPNATITIKVLADSLPRGTSIYVTGNDAKLGNWQPDVARLVETEKGKWSKKLSFTKGKKLEFKITRGSWDTEALNDDGSIPLNYSLEIVNDTTVQIKVNLWADMVEQKIAGQITGIVKYHLDFKGKKIKPRDIIVWLPPFYFLNPDKRYPVLYMHDGQNIFNPRTSAFRVDWQIDETADSLMRKGLMEDIIIVGICNTPDRRSEYSENDTGYAYINFIVDSLKPFIDRNYRTLSGREHTATGGSSMGGLISFMLTWERPDIFSGAICMSPAFKVRRFNYVDNVESYRGGKKDINLYIDNGGVELDSLIQFGVDAMLSAFDNKGYKQGEDFYWFRDGKAQHHESAWAKRIWRALIFLFGTEKGRSLL